MDIRDFLLVVCTSASMSALVTFLFRTSFQHYLDLRLQSQMEETKNRLSQQLEQVKVDMAVQATHRGEILHNKLCIYPGIVELVTRIHNMARDATASSSISEEARMEFATRVRQLEDALYQNRYYFDADGVTDVIHRYKNQAITLNILIGDIAHLEKERHSRSLASRKQQAERNYRQLKVLLESVKESLVQSSGVNAM